MNILIITMYFAPDNCSDSLLMSSLAEELAKLGHRVTVVCAFPHYKKTRLANQYRWKFFETERPTTSYKIIRTWVYVPSTQRFIKRFFNYLSFMITGLMAGLFSGPFDHVYVYTPPPSNGIAGYIISRIRKASMIYNVQDIYPDIGIQLGIFKNRFFIHLSQGLEKFFYAKADAITVISEGFRKNLLAKGVDDQKIHIIFNWVDNQFIKPLAFEESLRASRNWSDKFIVLYAGNIGFSQGLENLLEVAKAGSLPADIRFVIVGEGPVRNQLESDAIAQGLNNIEFLDFFPREQLPFLLASANISLVMMKPEVANESVPAKITSIMSSGRPILGMIPKDSDTWNIISGSCSGVCIEPGRTDEFLAALLNLYHNRELCEEMGMNGRDWVVMNCDKAMAAKKYHNIFLGVSKGANASK